MTTGPGDGEGIDTGQPAGPDPATPARPGGDAGPGGADLVTEGLEAVAHQAAADRTMFVLGVLDEEASTLPFESEVRRAGGQPRGDADADAAETERVVGELIDEGSRALGGERVVPGQAAPQPAAAAPVDAAADTTAATAAAADTMAATPAAADTMAATRAAADAGFPVTVPSLSASMVDPDPVGTLVDQLSSDLAAAQARARADAAVEQGQELLAEASRQPVLDAVVSDVTGTPDVPPAGAAPSGVAASPTGDGLRTIAAMTSGAPGALADRPAPTADFATKHQYNLAIAGAGIVALAAFVGAILFIGGSGGSPTGSAAPSGAAVIAGPSASSTMAATPETTPAATIAPSATPDRPSPAPSAAQSVTLRGPIDVAGLTSTGLSMSQHDAELVVFLDTNEVRGSFLLVVDRFPIGQLMASMDKAIAGSNDPEYEAFKACTVGLVLDGQVTGTYVPTSKKLSGTVLFQPRTDDVDNCLRTKPSNLTIDPTEAVDPTTVAWSATFDGTTAKGSIALDPAAPFKATREE